MVAYGLLVHSVLKTIKICKEALIVGKKEIHLAGVTLYLQNRAYSHYVRHTNTQNVKNMLKIGNCCKKSMNNAGKLLQNSVFPGHK